MALKTWVSGGDYSATVTLPAIPLSVVGWTKPNSAAADHILLILYDSAGSKYCRVGRSSGKFRASSWDGGSVMSATGTNAPSTGSWHHFAAVFDGTATSCTSRKIYTDGSDAQTESTTIAWSNASSKYVGLGGNAETETIGGADSGLSAAYFAIYSIALSAGDITSLQTLYPTSVQAGSLIHYWPLDATPPTDSSGSWDLTLHGSAATVDNSDLPPISAASGKSYFFLRSMQDV